jgi:hypothetical protein
VSCECPCCSQARRCTVTPAASLRRTTAHDRSEETQPWHGVPGSIACRSSRKVASRYS